MQVSVQVHSTNLFCAMCDQVLLALSSACEPLLPSCLVANKGFCSGAGSRSGPG